MNQKNNKTAINVSINFLEEQIRSAQETIGAAQKSINELRKLKENTVPNGNNRPVGPVVNNRPVGPNGNGGNGGKVETVGPVGNNGNGGAVGGAKKIRKGKGKKRVSKKKSTKSRK